MLRKLLFSIAGELAVLALLSGALFAQEYRGRIQGTVTDATQAVIPGATVNLLNVNTGVKAMRQSNESGHYLFDLVEPGAYTLTVEASGFGKFVQENVTLQT